MAMVIRSTRARRIYVVFAGNGSLGTAYTIIDRISPSYMRDRVSTLLFGTFDFFYDLQTCKCKFSPMQRGEVINSSRNLRLV